MLLWVGQVGWARDRVCGVGVTVVVGMIWRWRWGGHGTGLPLDLSGSQSCTTPSLAQLTPQVPELG